ncbi:formate dehydrogenase subunit alpha [Succinimonas amylolytica]|uniref:formate dehydrogenase subunit alpha n=1 Tax=Succinimonas amylolytica TaxID=83769 RepID=UPI0003826538|nr:formate dehydrogenase subunit alpha [Succinimonas amylolytica]
MSDEVRLTIDGSEVLARQGQTVLEVARENGIYIPTLCHLKNVNEIGACRMCVVEVEGVSSLVPSCNTRIWDGMVISTHTDKVHLARQLVLQLMLANHDVRCLSCAKTGDCELQKLANEFELPLENPYKAHGEVRLPNRVDNPFLSYYPDLCIGCQRCVSMCSRIVGNGVLNASKIGTKTFIEAPFGKDWKETSCELCGNCASACPTGALVTKNMRKYQTSKVNKVLTTCPHCATGCQFYLLVKDNTILDVMPANGPSNKGLLCVKGRFGSFNFVNSPDRLRYPLIKNRATGEFERATWDEALDLVARKFLEIKNRYGPDALAGFACSRSPNEDCYMLQKMVRCAFGTNNVDNCARVCHSATVAGLAMTLGSGAMTNPIADITEDVDLILLVGSNPEEAHPVIGMQIRQAVRKGAHLIVADPRKIGLSRMADIHLMLKPGTNVAFVNGMINIIISEGLADMEFIRTRTEGYEELCEIVRDYTPEKVAEICHIDPDHLREAARMYATAAKAPIIYCLGVTEHSTGTEGVMSLSNLAMITGKLGKSGCGVNPLRGQNNVQGACDMGALPGDLPGYQKITREDVIEKFEKAWNVRLNRKPGLHATDVFPAAIRKEVRGLFIFGEDPVVTDPDQGHVIKALESLDFLVMSEIFMTRTTQYADVILPGISYAEKEGTFSNTERRVQRVRKAVTLEGEMRPDTEIFIDLMNRMGYPQPHLRPDEIMDEIASLTPSFAGISHRRLDAGESIQWPCPSKDHPGTPILHVGKFTRGLGWLYPARYCESQELPDSDYPFILMTGRILYHYNTMAMTGRTRGLVEKEGHSFIEINTEDAARLGISHLEQVRLTSRRGTIESQARVSDKVSPGETWMPFHFADGFANILTNAVLDKYARIPEYKVCAIRIEKIQP